MASTAGPRPAASVWHTNGIWCGPEKTGPAKADLTAGSQILEQLELARSVLEVTNPCLLDDEALLAWIRHQAELGATVVGVCDGVPTLANSGVLAGRRATGHWRTIDRLEREHPESEWVRNRRYIADGNVITTSGVSASIPISMALVEAIGEEVIGNTDGTLYCFGTKP